MCTLASVEYLQQLKKQQNEFFKRTKTPEHYLPFTEDELIAISLDCANEEKWAVDSLTKLEVNVCAGQVRGENKKLVGYYANGYYSITYRFSSDAKSKSLRSHIILRNSVGDAPSKAHTADHNFTRPFDDRQTSIRWASRSEQAANKRKHGHVERELESAFDPDFSHIAKIYSGVNEVCSLFGVTRNTFSGKITKKCRYKGFYWRIKPHESIDGEIWKPLSSYRGRKLADGLEISDLGRYRRTVQLAGDKKRTYLSKGHVSKTSGYVQISLVLEKGNSLSGKMHIAVCESFIGPQPSLSHTVDHIDRIKENNNATNLRWATPYEQTMNRSVTKK